ncbi:MAG: tyrosine-protein phosphatase [Bacteroidaceae bacterium]|nr:tyrosine-protein phosphatase [Bacteroidaceae bacterium]
MKRFCILLALPLLVGGMSAQTPVAYSVENDNTHAFLTDFSYDSLDLDVSYIMDYYNRPHDGRLDAPKPVRLTWNHADGADAQRVEVSQSSTYSDSLVFTVHKDSAGYNLYNLIPGVEYYYRVVSVKADVETTVSTGLLAPEGMLRWIYAEGTWNVRDMGGWTGLGGHPIRYGQIFRGGQLTNPKDPYNILLTDAGIEAMRNAGIRAELDLRSSSQAHYSTTCIAKKDAENKLDADFTNIATTSARMWNYDADNSNIRAFQWIINELKAGKPVFYHCQNGADRTGTMGLLIGALLGMNESDLAKDYELTTFCQVAAVEFDPTEVGFARLRNYEGKKGSVDASSNPKDYMFAPVIDKWNDPKYSGMTIQSIVYNFFKNGVGGSKISEADLDWFIKYMVDYVMVKGITTLDYDLILNMEYGQSLNLNAQVSPVNATEQTLTYVSADTNVVKVSADGTVTAVGRGDTKVLIKAGNFVKTVPISIPLMESTPPASVNYDNQSFSVTGENKIKDGSFEYMTLANWKNAAGTALSKDNFELKAYPQAADGVYLESKADGDATSNASLRGEWTITKGRTYVFGYRVKNSTDKVTTENENLKVFMIKNTLGDNDASAVVLGKPSYDGNWKEVQYVFTAQANRLRILFTHLSQDGNNTCFDNFYLAELDVPSGYSAVETIKTTPAYAKSYDINGREVESNTRGLKIIDGKKVLISE